MLVGWYNGYSPYERAINLKITKRLLASGELVRAQGPCDLCNDPSVPVEYHSEDYALPVRCAPPAAYALCRNCHRDKLHNRFKRPGLWMAFLAHVRRGGYARDLKAPAIRREFQALRRAQASGKPFALVQMRPYARISGKEWFAHLRMDIVSLGDPMARPR